MKETKYKKSFLFLDSLYGDLVPTPVLRSQFFSCTQNPSETVSSFILRLRELYCRLRKHDPDNVPSDEALRDQLLLGLREGPVSQALKVYVRRNPNQDFTAIRQEALLLDSEHVQPQYEVTCLSINKSHAPLKVEQQDNW